MKKYRVKLQITTAGEVHIEAENETEAYLKARSSVDRTKGMYELLHKHGKNSIRLMREGIEEIKDEPIERVMVGGQWVRKED